MDLTMSARMADVPDVLALLQRQQDVKYDVVVPPTHLAYREGRLVVRDGAAVFDEDGVGLTDAVLAPTPNFERQTAEKLGIPYPYLERMRQAEAFELLDHNVNHWLAGVDRNLMVRGFRTDDPGEVGIARALLSDRFQVIDHLDAVLSALDGIRDAGVGQLRFERCELSETRLRINMTSPDLTMFTPRFLGGYVSPSGALGSDYPIIQAGIYLDNSETGGGAFTVGPWFLVRVCSNGQTRRQDALRRVHVGSRLEPGVIRWSEDTRRLNVEMIRAQARDAVATFLSRDYLDGVEAELEGAAGKLISAPQKAVDQVLQTLRYTATERESILDFFIRGAQPTAGGLMNAVTAYARTVDDPDRAIDLEDDAFEVLTRALALS